MTTYTPVKLAGQLIKGTGFPVIVTGWTIAKTVAAKLSPGDYSVVGQLYSAANGLSPLMRNILANRGYTAIILLEATREDSNAGSIKCLRDFFRYGFYMGASDTGYPCWVVDSDVAGYIDKEIPEAALEWVRQHIEITHCKTVQEVIEACRSYALIEAQDVEPQYFPETPPPVCPMFPGPLYGHLVRGETVAETWVKILNRIRTTGAVRKNGWGGQWQELIDLIAVVKDEPRGFFFPEPNYLPVDRLFIENYLGQILDDAPDREGVKYTYGQRLRSWFGTDQIEQVIYKLAGDLDSASAVMNLWDVSDHEKGGSPCLNHIWVRVNGDILTLTATFRSNDMFSAWPANAMGLRALQFHVVDALAQRHNIKLQAGELITVSQSAHVYDNCFTTCDSMRNRIKFPLTFDDPVGNFIVSVESDNIRAQWTTPTGATVKVYEGWRALMLLREIIRDVPYIEPGHAAYLGLELARAEMARNAGAPYRQDAP